VPRSAARPLRYLDRYFTVKQGEVFYITEALAQLEGIERGPAGNTSLTAAFALAMEMDEDQVIVVQETEYTGVGKHHLSQLSFARKNGIDIRFGNPDEEVAGKNIILPEHPSLIKAREVDLSKLRKSYIKNCIEINKVESLTKEDVEFLAQDTKTDNDFVIEVLKEFGVKID
ncbi:MAG: PLP-dependent lyase/thiolase, partial [Caloramator sp.]|nr:PLP-dependent lyase/thiolase [Caloramator sp.]